MAKERTFADKIYKKKHVIQCPVCKENVQPTLHMAGEKVEGGMKMRRHMVMVCKCTRSQVYG